MARLDVLVRGYREAAGLSQEELAERAGLSVRGLSDLERGLRRSPYPSTIRRLAAALDLTPEDRAVLFAAAQASPQEHPGKVAPAGEHGAYLGARAAFGLVGRRAEVDHMSRALDASLAGAGRLVVLSGEAGIGKTRLAQELAIMAEARGFIIATGRCYEPQRGVAFYPFLDALANLYTTAPTPVRHSVSDRWPYLERLLPDVFPHASATWSGGPDELQRLVRSAAGFVRACVAAKPVALLIDDLQWADQASLELLQHLVRHTQGDRLLIASTAREPELRAAANLRRALVDLQRENLVDRVRLERLDRADTGVVLGDLLGAGELAPELVDTIHAVSGGNPFFAIEVLQTMRGRGDLVETEKGWISRRSDSPVVPDTVRDSILERYAQLSATSAEVVDAAAVVGQTFRVDEIAAVLGVEENAIDLALEESIEAGLLHSPLPEATGDAVEEQYAFVHALTQQALYERLPPHRRRRMHLRAAEAVERLRLSLRSRRADALARHFQLALEPARALPYLLKAGDQAELVFAHHEARDNYAAASRIAAQLRDRAAEARSALGLGRSWLAAGRPKRALEHLQVAASAYSALEDAEGEAEALARVAEVYFARGEWDAGIERIPAVIERLERRQPSRALALLYACLAMVMPDDTTKRIGAAERASNLARTLGDDDLLVEAEARRGFVLMLAGRLAEARNALEAIMPVAQARHAYNALPIIIGVLSELTKLQGDIHGYLTLARRGVDRAEETGDQISLIGALSGVGEAEFLLGNWGEARRTYMRAAEQASGVDAAWYRGFVQLGLAAIDVAEGNTSSAERQLAECLTDGRRLGHQNRREHALRLLAIQHLLADDPAAALHRLDQVVTIAGDAHAGTQALRAWALLASGDLVGATMWVNRAVELAAAQHSQLDLCEALLVRGEVEREGGNTEAAEKTLTEALRLAQAMCGPYAEGRLQYARARLWADLSQVDRALQELEFALTTFARLGARPYLTKAKQLQLRLSSQRAGR